MQSDAYKIATSSKVAIVGGGPAGCFFAFYLMKYAKETGIHPDITIYEQRNFGERGSKGCKGCAGILSLSLLRNLSELNLAIPEEVIQSKIAGYIIHSPYISITIMNPEKESEVLSIYRGGGPRISDNGNRVSFDGWLLRETQKRGVRVENNVVKRILLDEKAGLEVAGNISDYDLVVLASGINAKPIAIPGLEYVPPMTQITSQDELYIGTVEVESELGEMAHAFLVPHSGLVFGSLVPKGPFVNVSVISRGKYPESVTHFLSQDIVYSALLKQYRRSCGCRPKAPVGAAHNYYSDRFVAVGDAVASRLYKDGIGSALLTAREAARTVVYHGISHQDFKRYYRPFCKRIVQDNRWGQLFFSLDDKAKNSRTFLLAQHRLITDERDIMKSGNPFAKVIWGVCTGSYSYRDIILSVLHPTSMARLFITLLSVSFHELLHKEAVIPKKPSPAGKKVMILGSGFGGMYVLRHLLASIHRSDNAEITMVSDNNSLVFSPLLHEVAMGRVESRHISYAIRKLHGQDRFNFVQANVENIRLSSREVITTEGTMKFDCLVLALGCINDMSSLHSTAGNVFTLKTIRDAISIRNHIISVFEKASVETDPERQKQMLTFVIAGGEYTGIELASELTDFIYSSLLKEYKTIDPSNIKIVILENGPKILPDLDTKLGNYVLKQLGRMHIEIRANSQIKEFSKDHLEINGSESIAAGTFIWLSGIMASPQVAELDVEKDNIGRVRVNKYLEVHGVQGVYALGDCAHFEDPRLGQPIPPLAHTAVRQAKVVAHNILADLRNGEKKPYHYSKSVETVMVGSSKAVLRFRRLRLYGILARFVLLAGYFFLMTGMYNRVKVALDWSLSIIFGRDITPAD
jgi:NADH dehydrogenase